MEQIRTQLFRSIIILRIKPYTFLLKTKTILVSKKFYIWSKHKYWTIYKWKI